MDQIDTQLIVVLSISTVYLINFAYQLFKGTNAY